MPTMADAPALKDVVHSLLDATERLQSALRRVDSDAILKAVSDQAEYVSVLESYGEHLHEALSKGELRQEFARISEMNAHNQILSMCGLRTIAQTINRAMPPVGYGDQGEPQNGSEVSSLKASI
ncbi:MAG: hypothetical protein KIS92_04195 [Planctomycetota bacterium]|nr:hypothetical protein [Planctomycetota bacterium]